VVHLVEGGDHRLHVRTLEADIGTFVTHLVAVVGSREDSQALSSLLVFITGHLDLVRPHNQFEIIIREEFRSHIRTEHAANAALARKSPRHIARIRPKTVDHDTFISRFLEPRSVPNIFETHVIF
jgi:hypothetical protein